jgi:CheY-like chemotaxis protein
MLKLYQTDRFGRTMMSRPITVHAPLLPLYHPTSVVLVDDDPSFLHALTMRLQGDFQCFAFRAAEDALAHLRKQQQHVDGALAAQAPVPIGAMEHIRDPAERALHVQASRLPRVFADATRFGTASVIVADPAKAGADGLSVLEPVRQAPLRKLLLTDADEPAATNQALTAGLTNAVCHKGRDDFFSELKFRLHRLQLEFFRELTRPIEPALTQADARFLQDIAVREAFDEFVAEHAIIEHCACIHPPGILGVDARGNAALMIVVDDDYRQASFEIAHAEGAPTELLRRLASGDALAVFPTRSGFYAQGLAVNWRNCLWEARKLGDTWYSAIIDEPEVARIVCGSIASYDSYRRQRLS